jgi:hypothetical protein
MARERDRGKMAEQLFKEVESLIELTMGRNKVE